MSTKEDNVKVEEAKVFDNVFGRVNSWGQALIFIFGILFFSITFYYQVTSNTVEIENNFKTLKNEIDVVNQRLDKKYNRQEDKIDDLFDDQIEIKEELDDEILTTAKFRNFIKGKDNIKQEF